MHVESATSATISRPEASQPPSHRCNPRSFVCCRREPVRLIRREKLQLSVQGRSQHFVRAFLFFEQCPRVEEVCLHGSCANMLSRSPAVRSTLKSFAGKANLYFFHLHVVMPVSSALPVKERFGRECRDRMRTSVFVLGIKSLVAHLVA